LNPGFFRKANLIVFGAFASFLDAVQIKDISKNVQICRFKSFKYLARKKNWIMFGVAFSGGLFKVGFPDKTHWVSGSMSRYLNPAYVQ